MVNIAIPLITALSIDGKYAVEREVCLWAWKK
jgi:hypothetical protein